MGRQSSVFRHSRESGNPASSFYLAPMKGGWVYILADRYRGGTYIGMTADLARRMWEHRSGSGSKFVAKYRRYRLVYCERHERIDDAIAREKAMKKWLRAWKIELIEKGNPDWEDLFDTING